MNHGEPSMPKAIASLAKKPSDVTRQGTQKLKFVPTLPARRKKEYATHREAKQEPSQPPVQPPERGNGRGRGRGRGRGAEGRGAAPRPPPVEMIASGPFAMGPALAGTSAWRSTPRSNFTPIIPQGPVRASALGTSLSNSTAPTSKKDKQHENLLADTDRTAKDGNDEEVYSEPDEGVEIIDMENVRQLDWMAPETLQREQRDRRKKNSLKTEIEESLLSSISKDHGPSTESVDPSNALDLSESEEEEEVEDLMEDFAFQANTSEGSIRQERLYFFQFPEPFPTFVSTPVLDPDFSREMSVDIPVQGPTTLKRKVSFAADTKAPVSPSRPTTPAIQDNLEARKETPKVDGVIGHMEVYRSGMVKMRLGNGIVLNVSEGTRPSFLQQAVHLDMENKKLHMLGEINKRFVVSPDLDTLLDAMDATGTAASDTTFDDPDLIKM